MKKKQKEFWIKVFVDTFLIVGAIIAIGLIYGLEPIYGSFTSFPVLFIMFSLAFAIATSSHSRD